MQNNPVRFSDPTGHVVADDDDGGCYPCTQLQPVPSDGGGGGSNGGNEDPDDILGNNDGSGEGGQPQADVTEWLVGEMDLEVWWLMEFVDCGWNQVCLYKSHLSLFRDYGKYDIKRSMLNYIGEAVTLCGGGGCSWVDYSAPGNIMYGYLSASRGIPQPVSWVAAGILEKLNSMESGQPYTGTRGAWGDNPGDKAAVDFGYALYEMYPDGITVEDFKIALSQETLNSFQAPPNIPNSPAYPAPTNGYPVDYFLWPTKP